MDRRGGGEVFLKFASAEAGVYVETSIANLSGNLRLIKDRIAEFQPDYWEKSLLHRPLFEALSGIEFALIGVFLGLIGC